MSPLVARAGTNSVLTMGLDAATRAVTTAMTFFRIIFPIQNKVAINKKKSIVLTINVY